MPELPDLEIVTEVLQRRVAGRRIEDVEVPRPLVLRAPEDGQTPQTFLRGRVIQDIRRRGKLLLFALDDGGWMVVSPMLAGRLRLCPAQERLLRRDYLRLKLSPDGAEELRYHDQEGMGKIYLTRDLASVPGYAELGPEALDPDLTLDAFRERLRPYRGEIKGVLTRGQAVAGIGNAYADEILFRAGLFPFRKRSSLSADEVAALYAAMRAVLSEAILVLRERVGEQIEVEVRDFLQVHNRKGQPCPRCGRPISEIKVAQRATNFCRHCQPGSLVRN